MVFLKENKHIFTDTLRENLGLAVYNTGYQKCAPGHTWGPALRDYYLIHYISAGQGVYDSGGREYPLFKGDLFLISPDRIVRYTADIADPWEYYWVGFNGADARRLLSFTDFSEESPVVRLSETDRVREILLRIYREGGNTPAADADMVGHLYHFFGCLIRASGDRPVAGGTQDYLSQALRFIQHNYASDISIADIARFAGVSRSQLYRAFVAGFGMSPHDFLQKYRISEACSLLRRRDYTVAEVASSVGFNDPLYFSRIFKRLKQMAPTEFRRRREVSGGNGEKGKLPVGDSPLSGF